MTGANRLMGQVLYRFAERNGVARVQRDYLRYFRDRGEGPVLDLGCGRGIFLDLLRTEGIPAAGVDGHLESVQECHALGFTDVTHADVLDFLEAQAAGAQRYGGILCSQLIEHLDGGRAVRLVELCAKLLAPRGRLVIVTPNVANLYVWTELFWCDPTHVRPYARPLLQALVSLSGLTVRHAYADPRTRSPALRRLERMLRYGLSAYSGVDLVVVGQKPE